ncbi:MAG: hypothetical protein ABI572_02750 [Actinomycetota bacterium]
MGCLIVLLALITPRLVLFLVWLVNGSYLAQAYDTFWLPLAGWLVLPATTLMYAIAENEFGGMHGGGLLLMILGVLIDVGLVGGSRAKRRRAD